jgi:hypothetical protein
MQAAQKATPPHLAHLLVVALHFPFNAVLQRLQLRLSRLHQTTAYTQNLTTQPPPLPCSAADGVFYIAVML